MISHSFLAFLGYLSTAVYTREQPLITQLPQAVSCHCGSNIIEAKSLGCKYDSLSLSWLPAQCRDDDLTAEFEHAGPNPDGSWPYYADKAANVSISIEEVAQLADLPRSQAVFYTTTGWHVAHCAFYWRKEYRMRAKGSMMESRYDKESHIKHCYMAFMSEDAKHEVNVASPVWLGGDELETGSMGHDEQGSK